MRRLTLALVLLAAACAGDSLREKVTPETLALWYGKSDASGEIGTREWTQEGPAYGVTLTWRLAAHADRERRWVEEAVRDERRWLGAALEAAALGQPVPEEAPEEDAGSGPLGVLPPTPKAGAPMEQWVWYSLAVLLLVGAAALARWAGLPPFKGGVGSKAKG